MEITRTICDNLSSAATVEELDETLVSISNALSDAKSKSISETDKLAIAEKVKGIIECAGSESLANNAKIRRRLRRTQQLLETDNQKDEKEQQKPPQGVKGFAEITKLFEVAKSVHDVETALNSVVLPDDKNQTDFGPLKKQLQKTLEINSLTNKKLQRRISRLVFVLSSSAEQEKLTADSKVKAEKNRNKEEARIELKRKRIESDMDYGTEPQRVFKNNNQGYEKESVVAPEPEPAFLPSADSSKSFETCIQELENTTSAEAIEAAIGGITTASTGDERTKKGLIAKLSELVSNDSSNTSENPMVLNAKLRRRLKRVIEIVEAGQTSDSVAAVTYSISRSPEEVMSAEDRGKEESSENCQGTSVGISAASSIENSASSGAITGTSARGDSIEHVIAKCRNADSAQDLEKAVADVKPEVGTCKSRRTLKRAIEKALAQEGISSQVTAKTRRRFTRVLKMLEPDAELRDRRNATEAKAKKAESDEKIVGKQKGPPAGLKSIPYVVFIGQLSFRTTAEQVEQHFRYHGVEGPIQVRLLSESGSSSRSKGMAFAELEGARELHKALTLHHSTLHGRMINVEKSCGGGKDKASRTERLDLKRTEQASRVQQHIDRILQEYQDKGVLTVSTIGEEFKEKLYNYSPVIVADVLQQYIVHKPSQDNSKLAILDKILTDKYGDTQQYQYLKVQMEGEEGDGEEEE